MSVCGERDIGLLSSFIRRQAITLGKAKHYALAIFSTLTILRKLLPTPFQPNELSSYFTETWIVIRHDFAHFPTWYPKFNLCVKWWGTFSSPGFLLGREFYLQDQGNNFCYLGDITEAAPKMEDCKWSFSVKWPLSVDTRSSIKWDWSCEMLGWNRFFKKLMNGVKGRTEATCRDVECSAGRKLEDSAQRASGNGTLNQISKGLWFWTLSLLSVDTVPFALSGARISTCTILYHCLLLKYLAASMIIFLF